jgi:putative ABC transport system permease protein
MTSARRPIAALREWISRLWGALGSRRRDAELAEELRLHLELAAEDERRRAHAGDAAARAAVIRHGALTQTMDALRDQRSLPWLDDLMRDIRYGVRTLGRTPLFATVVLLTLAIGIGATTAVFTVVNSVLLKPLAYPSAEELVAVWHTAPGASGMSNLSGDLRPSPSMYFTYAEQNRTFQHIGVWFAGSATVTGIAEPEELRSVLVSDGTLQALGVQPMLGRFLSQADQVPGAPQTVMLGYGYWLRRFGGDRSVIGRGITVGSSPREIVGVMPEGFRIVNVEPELIAPIGFNRSRLTLPGFGLQAVARLKPGVTMAEASADVARMVPIWMTSWPAAPSVNPRVYESWRITPALRPLKEDVVGNVTNALWVLMGTIGIVMLIACANIASLVLVRAEGRQQELAVRAALGAGRGRIVRGLVVESVLLGVMGGLLGLGVARVGLHLLVSAGPATLPRLNEIAIDPRALGFTLVVSLLSGLLFGLMPALKYAGPRISMVLRGGGRTSSQSRERHRARNILVVVQVALALVLLVSSGLMIRTFQALRTVEPGFTEPDRLQTVEISIPASLVPEPERVARLQNEIVDRLAAIPGVTSVGFASVMPMDMRTPDWDAVRAEGKTYSRDEVPPLRLFKSVSPRLFETSGTRLASGRDFTWTDLYDRRPVVMVSENLAREVWGTAAAAIGKRLRTLDVAPWREVIGVVQDVYDNGVNEPAPTTVYWPSFKESSYRVGQITVERTVTFAIRSRLAGTESLLSQVREAVWSANASLSLASERTMQDIYDQSMARTSFTLVILAIAGGMALALGVIGIYGVISYAVSQRTREIGIRLALGAQRGELKRMFVRNGLVLTGAGMAIGLLAAVALTRLMSSLLFGVSPLDPPTYVVVPILLVGATVVASYLPARRAAAVDPVEALKAE